MERLWRILEILVENVFNCSELNDFWELEDTVESSELDGKKSSKGKDTIEAVYVIFSITYKSFQFKGG